MAQLSWNAFIKKHKQGTCVQLHFGQYAAIKRNQKGEFVEKSTGKVMPTPNQIARALGRAAKGDFNLKSANGGTDQMLMFSDATQAAAIIAKFPHGESRRGDGKPVLSATTIMIDVDPQARLAKDLGLL